jgi:hypothetical protein
VLLKIKIVWGSQAFNYIIPTKATITFTWGEPTVGIAAKALSQPAVADKGMCTDHYLALYKEVFVCEKAH